MVLPAYDSVLYTYVMGPSFTVPIPPDVLRLAFAAIAIRDTIRETRVETTLLRQTRRIWDSHISFASDQVTGLRGPLWSPVSILCGTPVLAS